MSTTAKHLDKQYPKYMFFAIIAIGINVVVQIVSKELFLLLFNSLAHNYFSFSTTKLEYWFIFALGMGTVSGFVFKFVMDKFIVFEDSITTIEKTTRQISLYFAFAIVTTTIFWGFEFLFKVLFPEGSMYLIGGIIGLAIGYTVKFLLDKTYVFMD